MREEGSTLSFVSGMLVGAALGAGVALLFAPRSGRRTRQKLRHAATELGDRAGETVRYAADEAGHTARRVAGDARRAAERSGSTVTNTLKNRVEQGRDRLKI